MVIVREKRFYISLLKILGLNNSCLKFKIRSIFNIVIASGFRTLQEFVKVFRINIFILLVKTYISKNH